MEKFIKIKSRTADWLVKIYMKLYLRENDAVVVIIMRNNPAR